MDVIRQLAEPISPAAIAAGLQLAEARVRLLIGTNWADERFAEVLSADGCRSVRFTALAYGMVRVTHAVWTWYRGQHGQRERWGIERTIQLEAGDPRAARALSIIRDGGPAHGPDSHGS